jgi:hypothetical protein
MPDPVGHLRALAARAADAHRTLEGGIAAADGAWNDDARRGFEGDHLAGIRADARHLRIELEELTRGAAAARRHLRQP